MAGSARPLQGGFPAHLDVPAWFHARVREVVACDPDLADDPPLRPDAGYVARFGDDAPRYCGNCLFRDRKDVEARTVFEATRRTG